MPDPATLTSTTSPSVDEGPVSEPFGHPTETFDVEPPYTPDAAQIEAVEKFDDRFIDREVSWVRFNQRLKLRKIDARTGGRRPSTSSAGSFRNTRTPPEMTTKAEWP